MIIRVKVITFMLITLFLIGKLIMYNLNREEESIFDRLFEDTA